MFKPKVGSDPCLVIDVAVTQVTVHDYKFETDVDFTLDDLYRAAATKDVSFRFMLLSAGVLLGRLSSVIIANNKFTVVAWGGPFGLTVYTEIEFEYNTTTHKWECELLT